MVCQFGDMIYLHWVWGFPIARFEIPEGILVIIDTHCKCSPQQCLLERREVWFEGRATGFLSKVEQIRTVFFFNKPSVHICRSTTLPLNVNIKQCTTQVPLPEEFAQIHRRVSQKEPCHLPDKSIPRQINWTDIYWPSSEGTSKNSPHY